MSEVFSKVNNSLFYGLEGDKNRSMLKEINDDKVIIILHNLYLRTDNLKTVVTSINFFIELCGYSIAKKTQKEFKDILHKLSDMNVINIDREIKSYNQMLVIDTENLSSDKKFFMMNIDEVKTIRNNSSNNQEFINMLKVYYYLKARVYKSDTTDSLRSGRSQTTFNSYMDISKHTLIGESSIKKYIKKLQDIELIKYANLGYKYFADDIKTKTDCANLYALTKISGEFIDKDIEEGLKQQRYYYEEKGYTITSKGYRQANNKQFGGKYGSLIKKEKNGTITKEEIEELNRMKLVYELIRSD